MPDWIQEIPTWGHVLGALLVLLWVQQHLEQKRRREWEERFEEQFSEELGEMIEWVREVDPRMEYEKHLLQQLDDDVEAGSSSFAGMELMSLQRDKERRGERTYVDPLRKLQRWKEQQESKKQRK